MILDSFSLHNVIFQIQYVSAYALWDRAGSIATRLCDIWPNLKLIDGQPQQQTLSGNGVQIQTGLERSTVTIGNPKALGALHTKQLSETFDTWRNILELKKLGRISTRIVFEKVYPSIKEANAAVGALSLTKWPTTKVFDQPMESGTNGIDVQFRFEDEQSFSVLRVKTEKLKIEVGLDPYFFDEPNIEKEKNRMLIDFDRGLLGSVEAANIRVEDWMKGVHHLLRRDIEKVIGTA